MRSVEDFLSEHRPRPEQDDDLDMGESRQELDRTGSVSGVARVVEDGHGRDPGDVSRDPGDMSVDTSAVSADVNDCREAALRLLDAAARPSGALRVRLLTKGYQPDVVDDVIHRLERVELLDDRQYAQAAIRYCAGRMMGFRGAVMELVRKGVDRQLAEEVARDANDQGTFTDAAWELGRRVAAKTRGLDPQVRLRRFWSAGGRKGHDSQTLHQVAHELFDHQ